MAKVRPRPVPRPEPNNLNRDDRSAETPARGLSCDRDVFTEAGIDRLESRLLLVTALASKDVGKPIAANQITIDPPSPFGIHPKTIRF
jgi:hypothetical protein